MWSIESIQARWREAADVERRLQVKGIPTSGNAWPVYTWDRTQWDDTAHSDLDEMWRNRRVTRSDELSRWGECYFEWHMKLVPLDRRELIWAWARWAADVDPRPFSKICDHNGWARATAYARLERLWDHLLFNFGNAFIPFRPAADRWARLASQPIVINEARVADCAPVKHAAFISEKSTDTLKTPDAIAAFVAHLEDVNEHRRRALVKRLGRDMAA